MKTSGSKGFHILIPLDGEGDAESSWRFAHGAGAVLVKRHPELLTQEFIKADRGNRIFVDTGRNLPGATFAAVYAVRPKPGAPVSAPCTWEELERATVGPQTFALRTMAARIADAGDLWSGMDQRRCSLRDATDKLRGAADRGGLERGAGRVDAPADVAQGADQGERKAERESEALITPGRQGRRVRIRILLVRMLTGSDPDLGDLGALAVSYPTGVELVSEQMIS